MTQLKRLIFPSNWTKYQRTTFHALEIVVHRHKGGKSYVLLIIYFVLFSLNNGEPLITTYNPQPRNTQVVSMPDLQRGDDISEDESIDLDISEDESTDSKRSVLPSQNT